MNINTATTQYAVRPPFRGFKPELNENVQLGLILHGKKLELLSGSAAYCASSVTRAVRQSKDVILLRGALNADGTTLEIQNAELFIQPGKAQKMDCISAAAVQERLKQLTHAALQTLALKASAQQEIQVTLHKGGLKLCSKGQVAILSRRAALKLAQCLKGSERFENPDVRYFPHDTSLHLPLHVTLTPEQRYSLAQSIEMWTLFSSYMLEATSKPAQTAADTSQPELLPCSVTQDELEEHEESVFY